LLYRAAGLDESNLIVVSFGLEGNNTRDLLADHAKIGAESLVKIAPIENIDRLITDAGISAYDQLAFGQRNVDVTIADQY